MTDNEKIAAAAALALGIGAAITGVAVAVVTHTKTDRATDLMKAAADKIDQATAAAKKLAGK